MYSKTAGILVLFCGLCVGWFQTPVAATGICLTILGILVLLSFLVAGDIKSSNDERIIGEIFKNLFFAWLVFTTFLWAGVLVRSLVQHSFCS